MRGVYLPAAVHADRSRDAAHRDLAYAHELLAPHAHAYSHATAAALWRLPRIGAWPRLAHVVSPTATGGRSEGRLRRHGVGAGAIEVIDGLQVTGLVRTVIDLCRTEGFLQGVLAADHALRGIEFAAPRLIGASREQRREERAQVPGGRGVAVAREAVGFADGKAGSPGESLSRVRMRELGLPIPELQVCLRDDEGEMYPDFCWRSYRLLGEFDGVAKYIREEFQDGRSPAEGVVDEKRREDRLRGLGWRVVRWGWDDALSAPRLRAILTAAGLR
jgi:hypothetical protein